MTQTIDKIIKNNFPTLHEEELIEEIKEHGNKVSVEANDNFLEIGRYIKQMPLLIKGTVKVSREDNEGNELLLYYLNSGETCAMSLTCCMRDVKSNVRATAIEDTEMIMLPVSKFDEWMSRFNSWRGFVLQAYQMRFEEILQTVDSIAFMKMDERLEKYLIDRANELNSKIINLTHQEIANDLHTSREVISRLLKQLEKLGRIKLHRYKIELIKHI